MYKIYFICSWMGSGGKTLEMVKRLTPSLSGCWKDLFEGTDNIKEADYWVILEDYPDTFPIHHLSRDRLIAYSFEPPCIRPNKKWFKLNLINGFTFADIYYPMANFDFIGHTFDYWNSLEYPTKLASVSCVVSGKTHTPGATQRLNFIKQLLPKCPLLDVYGCNSPFKPPQYKGTIKTKSVALTSYKYSICMENCSIENYFTEKFTDAILCWTIPIYWGCTNIANYFPPGSYYLIDITKPEEAVEIVNKIITLPVTEEQISALKEARRRVLYEYNIWPTLERTISNKKLINFFSC